MRGEDGGVESERWCSSCFAYALDPHSRHAACRNRVKLRRRCPHGAPGSKGKSRAAFVNGSEKVLSEGASWSEDDPFNALDRAPSMTEPSIASSPIASKEVGAAVELSTPHSCSTGVALIAPLVAKSDPQHAVKICAHEMILQKRMRRSGQGEATHLYDASGPSYCALMCPGLRWPKMSRAAQHGVRRASS